jgi:hypothetical protein
MKKIIQYILIAILLILFISFFYPKQYTPAVYKNCFGVHISLSSAKKYCAGIIKYDQDSFVHPILTVKTQMIDQMKYSGNILEISRPKIDIKPSEIDQIFLGFKNDKDYMKKFIIRVNQGTGSCQDIQIEYKTAETSVDEGDVIVLPMNVKTGESSIGSCLYRIEADYGSDLSNPEGTETVELIVNVIE